MFKILQQADWYGFPCPHPQRVRGWSDCPSGEASEFLFIYLLLFFMFLSILRTVSIHILYFMLWAPYPELTPLQISTNTFRLLVVDLGKWLRKKKEKEEDQIACDLPLRWLLL